MFLGSNFAPRYSGAICAIAGLLITNKHFLIKRIHLKHTSEILNNVKSLIIVFFLLSRCCASWFSRSDNQSIFLTTLRRLRNAVKRKPSHFWMSIDWLLYDNFSTHSVHLVQTFLTIKLCQSSYGPDIASCDFSKIEIITHWEVVCWCQHNPKNKWNAFRMSLYFGTSSITW